jgi:hypothetical protein
MEEDKETNDSREAQPEAAGDEGTSGSGTQEVEGASVQPSAAPGGEWEEEEAAAVEKEAKKAKVRREGHSELRKLDAVATETGRFEVNILQCAGWLGTNRVDMPFEHAICRKT